MPPRTNGDVKVELENILNNYNYIEDENLYFYRKHPLS